MCWSSKYYRILIRQAALLIVWLGNYRCQGHGTYEYMVNRVLGDIRDEIALMPNSSIVARKSVW